MSIMDGLELGANSLLGGFGQATLSRVGLLPDSVRFQYNPASIVISHTAPMSSSPAPRGNGEKTGDKGGGDGGGDRLVSTSVEELTKAHGFTTIAIRQVTFDGPKVPETCVKLHDWSQFEKIDAPLTQDAGKTHKLPELKFVWGPALTYPVTLNQVTITFTRFSRFGTPVRALVDMTLNLRDTTLTPTNPSSGGVPGRRTHLLTGAETLAELATRTYGSPGRWRDIAAANGIQDPLRVRPGTLIYLPSTRENGR